MKAAKKKKKKKKRASDWRVELYRKQFCVEAWDWKENPSSRIRSLLGEFGLRPSLAGLDAARPDRLLERLARKYGLFVYDLVSIRGSDMYGFILSKQRLSRRDVQQVEADYWGEDYDDVYR